MKCAETYFNAWKPYFNARKPFFKMWKPYFNARKPYFNVWKPYLNARKTLFQGAETMRYFTLKLNPTAIKLSRIITDMQFRMAQGYLARIIFKCVQLSLFIITKLFIKFEYLLLFKLNQLMVPIGKKPAPRRPRIQFENFPCMMSLCLAIQNIFL